MQLIGRAATGLIALAALAAAPPGEDPLAASTARLEAAAEGVRPALGAGDARRLTAPHGPCPPKGTDEETDEAMRARLRDAGKADVPLTRSGCRRAWRVVSPSGEREELWVFEGPAGGKGPRGTMIEVEESRPGLSLEGRDSNGDGLIDLEILTTRSDAGETVTAVEFSYPYDGGHAGSQVRSTALGGNRRHVARLRWRDGGWLETESFDSTWRDEQHYPTR